MILGPLENGYLPVAFESDGIRFETKTYLYKDAQVLTHFFKDLAANWQGWSGSKAWKSIENDFKLDATHNGISAVYIKVSLVKNQGEDTESLFTGKLKIDLGSLVNVATELAKSFDSK